MDTIVEIRLMLSHHRLERRSEMPEGNEPVALAMVLCDGIHIDPGTGKRTLLGLFNSACSPELPARINSESRSTPIP